MGTPDDFAAAFPAPAARAYRVAFRILGDRRDAEDVVQETLARALVRWRRVATYAEAWTAATSSNLAIGIWRKRERPARSLPRPSPPTDEHLHDRMELVRLLRELPRRQRDLVVLRYVADLSEADVAAALGCSVGSVKRHAHRGLAALRVAIDTDGGTSCSTSSTIRSPRHLTWTAFAMASSLAQAACAGVGVWPHNGDDRRGSSGRRRAGAVAQRAAAARARVRRPEHERGNDGVHRRW